MCYAACILLVNATLIKLSNNYTGYLESLAILNIALFWIFVAMESKITFFGPLYKNWEEFVNSPAVWLGLILVTLSVYTVDLLFRFMIAIIVAVC